MSCTQPHNLMMPPLQLREEAAGRWFWGCVGLSVTLHLLVVLAATGWTHPSPDLETPDEPGIAVEFQINALPSSAPAAPPQEPRSTTVGRERQTEETISSEVPSEKKNIRPKHAEADGTPNGAARGEARPSPQGNPRPEYPDFARRKGWQGECLLRVVVTPEGRADGIAVHRSSGYAILDQSAVAAVKRWRFMPRVVGGECRVSTIEVPVNFSLLER